MTTELELTTTLLKSLDAGLAHVAEDITLAVEHLRAVAKTVHDHEGERQRILGDIAAAAAEHGLPPVFVKRLDGLTSTGSSDLAERLLAAMPIELLEGSLRFIDSRRRLVDEV